MLLNKDKYTLSNKKVSIKLNNLNFSKEAVALTLAKNNKADYYGFDDGVMIQFN